MTKARTFPAEVELVFVEDRCEESKIEKKGKITISFITILAASQQSATQTKVQKHAV